MEGELKKMVIEAYRKADYSGSPADSFTVMFNPNTYTQKYEVEYQDRQGQGDTGSPQVFGKIKPQEYSFEFLFDGTGTATDKVDVQQTIDRFLTVTGKHDGEIHRPLYLKLCWGSLISKCVLKSAEITHTLFKRDGYPLRSKVKATFAENVEDALRVAQERKSSPDLTHVHIVEQGEHLSLLAHKYYGDESRYIQVAAYNNLKNFRRLELGQRLLFPPIKDVGTEDESA
ncbi:MAG: LysM domain-containing protein [Acidobacteria bacterium]|nr:MAG: LysM domain-containing protein [Acidobacteriota bacterium]